MIPDHQAEVGEEEEDTTGGMGAFNWGFKKALGHHHSISPLKGTSMFT